MDELFDRTVNEYRKGRIEIAIDKNKATTFIQSDHAKAKYRLASLLWTGIGCLLVIPLPIYFLIRVSWIYSLFSLVSGLVILSAAKKSDAQFILYNILEDADFLSYCLIHKVVKIQEVEHPHN